MRLPQLRSRNELPPSGAWPGPIIAKSIRYKLAWWTGSIVYGRSSRSWAEAIACSNWLESFPSAPRVGLAGISDDGLCKLASMRGLLDLELSDTTILGKGLGHLAGLPQLRRLQLLGVPLNAKGKEQLAVLNNLEELVVWDDGLFGGVPLPLDRRTADTFEDDLLARLGGLKKLRTLRFCTCSRRLTAAGMGHLAEIRALRVLAIGICANRGKDLGANFDDELAPLESLDNLEDLTLYGHGFTDRAMEHVARLRSLMRLELCETGITHVGLARVADLRSLRALSLRCFDMSAHVFPDETGEGLESLGDLTVLKLLKGLDRLEELTVDGDQVSEAAVPYLREMRSLVKLRFRGVKTWPMSDGLRERLRSELPSLRVEEVETY